MCVLPCTGEQETLRLPSAQPGPLHRPRASSSITLRGGDTVCPPDKDARSKEEQLKSKASRASWLPTSWLWLPQGLSVT